MDPDERKAIQAEMNELRQELQVKDNKLKEMHEQQQFMYDINSKLNDKYGKLEQSYIETVKTVNKLVSRL